MEVNTDTTGPSIHLRFGGQRRQVSTYDLALLGRLIYFENSNILGSVLFADNDIVVVYWGKGGCCVFRNLSPEHLDVLKAMTYSTSGAEERKTALISYTDTVLTLSDIYGCEGDHKRSCPTPGARERSLIYPDGTINTLRLEVLR